MDKKALSNAFRHKLQKAPEAVRKFYYDNGLKNLKAETSEQKKKFMGAVLDGDWEAATFKRTDQIKQSETTKSDTDWISWEQVKNDHGASLCKAMIEQGTLQLRLHSKLDPNHPSTQALDAEERFEYQRVHEVKSESLSHVEQIEKATDQMPVDEEEPEPTKTDEAAAIKAIVNAAKAQVRQWSVQEGDMQKRLEELKANEYPRGQRTKAIGNSKRQRHNCWVAHNGSKRWQ